MSELVLLFVVIFLVGVFLFARKGRKQREREAAQLEASRLLKELILALNSRR
jgi:preprotein translocase subunit YajC